MSEAVNDTNLVNNLLTMPEFKGYPKTARFENITISITEKIDGTNSVIYINHKDNLVMAGSKNRWLYPGNKTDNYSFAEFVRDNKTELLKLPDGYHYGEWAGSGINRNYGMTDRSLFMFNPSLIEFDCQCIKYVPELGITSIDHILDYIEYLQNFVFKQDSEKRPLSKLDNNTLCEGLILQFNESFRRFRIKLIWDK